MSWPAQIPIVFTRSSPATRFNGKGLLVTAGVNEARHDFGPTTKAARGLLIEAAFTNACLWSEAFDNAVWTKGNGSITANSVVAPDGAQTMDLFTVTATGSGAQVYQDVATTASVRQAASFFFKKFDTNFACITVSDGAGNGRRWWFNLNTGAVASTAGAGTALTNVGYRIEDVGGGIYRCFVAWLHNASTMIRVEAYPVVDADASIGVTAGRRGYVWGGMAGVGEDCGSYLATTTLAATRAADIARLSTTGLLNPLEFTLYSEFGFPKHGKPFSAVVARWCMTAPDRTRSIPAGAKARPISPMASCRRARPLTRTARRSHRRPSPSSSTPSG